MSSVVNLIKLDISILKPYVKSYLIILLSPFIIAFTSKDPTVGIIFLMSMVAMTSNFTFSISEKNDMNRLYGLLPVERTDIVLGRYISVIFTGILALVVGYIINLAVMYSTKTVFTNEDMAVATGIGLFMFVFNISLQLPAYFKFGAVKGKFISFIPFVGMGFAGVIAQTLNKDQISWLNSISFFNNTGLMLFISVIIDILMLVVSFIIANRIFNNIEM